MPIIFMSAAILSPVLTRVSRLLAAARCVAAAATAASCDKVALVAPTDADQHGTSTISATVIDRSGNRLVGVPVAFSITGGSLSAFETVTTSVAAGSPPISAVEIVFGDGSGTVPFGNLTGSTSVTHVYTSAGTRTVTVTATTVEGGAAQAS